MSDLLLEFKPLLYALVIICAPMLWGLMMLLAVWVQRWEKKDE